MVQDRRERQRAFARPPRFPAPFTGLTLPRLVHQPSNLHCLANVARRRRRPWIAACEPHSSGSMRGGWVASNHPRAISGIQSTKSTEIIRGDSWSCNVKVEKYSVIPWMPAVGIRFGAACVTCRGHVDHRADTQFISYVTCVAEERSPQMVACAKPPPTLQELLKGTPDSRLNIGIVPAAAVPLLRRLRFLRRLSSRQPPRHLEDRQQSDHE